MKNQLFIILIMFLFPTSQEVSICYPSSFEMSMDTITSTQKIMLMK